MRLKREINLVAYAGHYGYVEDRRRSTKTSTVMKLDKGDKIVVAKPHHVWIYFSVYDDQDHGTILDFIKNRTGQSLYAIGRALESGLGNLPDDYIKQGVSYVKKQAYDPGRVHRLFNHCHSAIHHHYLLQRDIPQDIINSSRFVGRIFQDQFRNAVFPHFKAGQICGLELKSEEISLFVRGSEKTLWRSNHLEGDDTLLIAESPIDTLSYQTIHHLKTGFYIATCGGLSTKQGEMIQDMLSQTDWIKAIIIITDHDEGGDGITQRLERFINQSSFSGSITRHSPQKRGCDWNDVLSDRYADFH